MYGFAWAALGGSTIALLGSAAAMASDHGDDRVIACFASAITLAVSAFILSLLSAVNKARTTARPPSQTATDTPTRRLRG
jgi:hypothetical protein